MPTLNAQVSDELLEQIDAVARQLDRSRAWVIEHALRRLLDERAHEERWWQQTVEAIAAGDRGEVIAAEEVFEWLDTWGQPDGDSGEAPPR